MDESKVLGVYVTVIAGAITVIAFMIFSESFPSTVRLGALIAYLTVLATALALVTNVFSRARSWRRERKKRLHWQKHSRVLLEKISETIDDIGWMRTSTEGTIDFLVRDFFDRPVAFSASANTLPTLDDALPGFHDDLSVLTNYGASLGNRVAWMMSRADCCSGNEIESVLKNVAEYFNSYAKWSTGIFDVLKKHSQSTPSRGKVEKHYLKYRDKYAKAVSDLEKLKQEYDSISGLAGGTKVYFDIFKREQEPFLK